MSQSLSASNVLASVLAPPLSLNGTDPGDFALFAPAGSAFGEYAGAAPAPAPSDLQRQLTILFSDLSSSVGLAAEMDWQPYVQLMRELRELFRATVACHGGTIARMQGDGMLAVFGHAGHPGDDGYHAIRCALALHGAVRAISPDAPDASGAALHSGIYAGLTYVESGDLERGRFDLVGSAPSLASRLSGLAGRNGILVAEQVIAARLEAFEVSERLTLAVKGWPSPLRAYRVLGLSASGLRPQKW
ncbi:adenylate/guanylate cyclase domain-containing protein [Variovorax sp. OV329]|uniref:adenylate/guanylate cyclase domain-containing protein n=1 Tax=Variovorax sp. OV329 TaxID=1882825 RepID=UPI0008F18C1E|nr:adenylate/guanylate cyclase domain-containing protein [Variovorax sp. OV329]SFM05060.1 Adenylate cyclase, class 3 [Variovorax sp. OV329]